MNDIKLYFLTFRQGFKTISSDGGIVNKHILTIITGDETKSFVVVKPLNSTSNCHDFESQVLLLRLNPPASST